MATDRTTAILQVRSTGWRQIVGRLGQMQRYLKPFRRALWQAMAHDVLNTAKAAAYSAMLMLFPALLVLTTLLAQVPDGPSLVGELRGAFEQILPADTMDILQDYVLTRRVHSVQVILSATMLSVFASMGVMLSLMEGFRRAYRLPSQAWGFWEKRGRAMMLVPIVLLPLALATLVIVFGRQIEHWMVSKAGHELRHYVLVGWRMVRWAVALLTSVSVLGALYHFGTRRKEHWLWVLPGAVTSTVVWFPATLVFGWYVTRVADYSVFYGPFGTGIATLVWLYLTAFSCLLGAELNGVLFREREQLLPASRRQILRSAQL